MEKIISSLNGQEYNIKDVARVIDKKLQTLYVKNGLRPIDLSSGFDNDGKDIIVMYFDRKESSEYYAMWLNRTLK